MAQPGRPQAGREGEAAAEGQATLLGGFGVNAGIVEEIRQRHALDPASVDPSWSAVFVAARSPEARAIAPPAAPASAPAPAPAGPAPGAAGAAPSREFAEKHARVLRMIHAFRARGHRIARVDPLGASDSYFPELDPAHYGLGRNDLERTFIAGDLPGGPLQPLGRILERLRNTYCRNVAVEFTHVQDPGRKNWIQRRMEETENTTPLGADDKLRILEKLAAAELFERFLHTRFMGQKRFSLEGAESLIPLLDTLVEAAAAHGAHEVVLGMAHRGRLNVLSNILGKSLESIFCEFEDVELSASPFGSGDVKYHKGYSSDRITAAGTRIHLSLTANPSHLEAVDPVVLGRTRAKQTRSGDARRYKVLPVLVHGDAAFAGQGMVSETLNLCHLQGYSTGGAIHVVVNNQIGFTTSPCDARSTLYCTDVAKMIQAPIFHVNGDEPEAVVHCVRLALAYRQRFATDVVIDLVCYRRHGHNEGDEPSFTQPLLYEKIRRTKPVRERYTEALLRQGLLRAEDARDIEADLHERLQSALQQIQTRPPGPDEPYDPHGPWSSFSRTRSASDDPETGVPIERLAQVAERLGAAPPDFALHPKIERLLERRRKMVAEGGALDWAMAEALAFGSLLVEGTPVRLSGQDSARGTFNQRHAVLVDQRTGKPYAPHAHLAETQARFEVYDSQLSEAAVLGFEYGYSLADPTTLTLWEAQFGDFANGAQVIIDQFIAAAHAKWQRMSGLVLLLPHGYEGQGPEHSSARVERFLQLCAEDNLQVANCSTPAQYFHLLRRQMRRRFRAPLVVFTPKSLLRDPRATSPSDALTRGRFFEVLDDEAAAAAPEAVRRILVCSGKVYYDLAAKLEERAARGGPRDVALLRVEQLYPWPDPGIARAVRRYTRAERVFFVQEEPANMGAWTFVRERIQELLPAGTALGYAGRPASASPAVGSARIHRREQAALVDAAFSGLD